ncbi:MAG: hypothetical protein V7L27_14480 [Nostoc sp.]|uniref:hypothetical protein n=1 Tax=Nostoc sp. TaxID=1180 RepID=UPI002FFBAC71
MNWKQLTIVFISTIVFLFAGNAIAQTDLNINKLRGFKSPGSITGKFWVGV